MKLTELIAKAQNAFNNHGDMDVYVTLWQESGLALGAGVMPPNVVYTPVIDMGERIVEPMEIEETHFLIS